MGVVSKRQVSVFAAQGTLLLSTGILLGCASPGLPRAPSLHIPEPVTDLAAERIGDTVELHFSAPSRSTDGLPLRPSVLLSVLCRDSGEGTCTPVGGERRVPVSSGQAQQVRWRDDLPPALADGVHRPLAYRVAFPGPGGRAAEPSEAAYTVAGTAPVPVQGFAAQGSRDGVVLRWRAQPGAAGDVLLRRDTLPSAGASKAEKWMTAGAGVQSLDASAQAGMPYGYVAVRCERVALGGRALEIRSVESPVAELTLLEIYPPAPPVELHAAGFAVGTRFGVDLIWQPVDDPKLLGYNIYRQGPAGARSKLNAQPVALPAFHDAEANSTTRYRYSVTAIDAKGNESAAATAVLEPQPR